jgi:hypothetical protein
VRGRDDLALSRGARALLDQSGAALVIHATSDAAFAM